MTVDIPQIQMREVLHFLGWRGQSVEESLKAQIRSTILAVQNELRANVITRQFELDAARQMKDTAFIPKGNDICALLRDCDRAIVMAATLGAQSERLLLRTQAKSSADALLMDAVLSAAIEAVCDEQERLLREDCSLHGLYLTDRFSPGYGDMPLEQSREICAVLQTEKTIGLTVAASGIMIPRKSVTAILGISSVPQKRRPSPCALCSMNQTCVLREIE